MDVVSACYFTTGTDCQRGNGSWPTHGPEADALVQTWWGSVGACGLHAIVLYDELDPRFVAKWSAPWCEWVKVEPDGRYGIYDARWPHRQRIIASRPDVEHWCFTDISDVEFFRSPFELMHSNPGKLWLSSETVPFEENGWMRGNWLVAYGDSRPIPMGPLYNAGLFGGASADVAAFTGLVLQMLDEAHARWKRTPTPITMDWYQSHVLSSLPIETPLDRLTYVWLRKFTEMWEQNGMSCEMCAVNAAARLLLDAEGLGSAYAREVKCRYDVDVSRLVTTGCIATGFPWHTRFKAFEGRESGCAVRHK